MALDVSADTAAIYGDWSQCVTFTLASGSEVRADAIFTEPAEIFDVAEGQMTAVAPTLMVPTCKVTDLLKGDTASLKVDGETRTFSVARIQKCGTEDSVVYLKT